MLGSPKAARHRPCHGRATAHSPEEDTPSVNGHSTALVLHEMAGGPVLHSGKALAGVASTNARWQQEVADVASIMPNLVFDGGSYRVILALSLPCNGIAPYIVCHSIEDSVGGAAGS